MKTLLFLILSFCGDKIIYSQDSLITSTVIIHLEIDSTIFPKSWFENEIKAKVTPIDSSEVDRSLDILANALSKYPTPLINNYVHHIYVLNSLEFFGLNYGGSYFENTIYLTNQGIANNYTDKYIEKLFHAEFSSILLNSLSSVEFEAKWNAINPKHFSYSGDGKDAIQSGKQSEKFSEEIIEQGFLTEYAMSSMENDFNSIAKHIFMNDPIFWEITENNKRIKKKALLFIDFYNQLHPIFSLNYFEKINK